MKIATISLVIPNRGCVNKCPFCVSRMHDNSYQNNWNELAITKRIKYSVMNGVNTCILTGTGEAMENLDFLYRLRNLFEKMHHPFPNVELQTTGVFLSKKEEVFDGKDGELLYNYPYLDLLKDLGVSTISLSVANIFDSELNSSIIGIHKNLDFKLDELIVLLKEHNFNVRLSLNMLKEYDNYSPSQIINRCKELRANQITFRKMYYDLDKDGFALTKEAQWTKENKCSNKTLEKIKRHIEGIYETSVGAYGQFLYKLPFGGKVYSIEGMSTVIDDDCMSKENNDSLKYVVLREDGKLYCRWDDTGSLIF